MAVTYKLGCDFTGLKASGFRIIDALKAASDLLGRTLIITCACEGHGPDDPHTLGEALDIRSHDIPQADKQTVLQSIMIALRRGDIDSPVETSQGLATLHFFGWLEHAGQDDEHYHVQRRKGTTYTIDDYLKA